MPDDERPRRRLGDETKNRIADLASGWSLDGPAEELPAPAKPEANPAATPAPAKPTAPAPKLPSLPDVRAKSPTAPPPPPSEARAKPATTPPPPPASDARAKPATTPPPPPRNKPRTVPPPPPGSAERKAVEDKIVATAGSVNAADRVGPTLPRATNPAASTPAVARTVTPQRPGRTTVPSDPPPVRSTLPAKPATPPAGTDAASGPKFPRPDFDGPATPFATEGRTFSREQRTPAVIVDESLTIPEMLLPAPDLPHEPSAASGEIGGSTSTKAKRVVPIGEFDSGVRTVEQSTTKRDPADALLAIPDKVTPVEDLLDDDDEDAPPPPRGDATMIDPQTTRFERGDPTQTASPDATEIQAPSTRVKQHTGGTFRPSAALRRKRGLYGDVRYVFTALFGVRTAKREVAVLEHRQNLRQTSRRRHLVTLGRSAVINDTFDHPALGKAREHLQMIEDERSKHAGAVAASDAELERVRRDRETKAKQYVEDIAKIDSELAELARKLEPLEKEAIAARRRGQELREALQRLDKKVADTELLLDSVKAEKLDKAAIRADIVTLKADRQAVLRDEPVIAAELDALNPRIAAIEANRAELRRKRGELEKAETDDQRRTSELLEAIGAKRKVVERAAADAETARDTALFELGDRLYVDRPKVLAAQLSPIDQIDLELGEGDRRMMELREILSNIDKAKFARGLAMIILALGVVGSIGWLLATVL